MELEKKIKKLKELVSDHETTEFLTFLAGVLLQIPQRHENPFLKKLMSPMRQLFFLGLLNLNRNSTKDTKGFDEKEWDEIASLLHGIEMEYFFLLGFPKQGRETKEDIEKIGVTMPTFMNYFFNGPLAYQEQEIERIEKVFLDFEPQIIKTFGLSLSDFIAFYDLISDTIDKNLNFAVKFLNKETWQEFTGKCVDKGLLDPKDWINEAPEAIMAFLNFTRNPGSFLILDLDKLDYSTLPREKFEKIINLFVCSSNPTNEIAYYTEENELLKKPFLKISDTEYLPFYLKQYLNSCYNFLFSKCLEFNNDKALKCRDNYIEQKTERVFKKLFKNEGHFYTNYSIDNGISEQDLLILYNGNAIIIEVKASSYRAPMRDAHKAFDKLKSDFKKSIQYGHEQISRVTKAFQTTDKLPILDSKKKLLYEIPTGRYKTYSIIVTLERFGHIQTNLDEMLQIDDTENYPWCVNIDDLEAFLLTLSKQKNKLNSFLTFLQYRQKYHGHLACSDELELCGSFLTDGKEFCLRSLKEETIVTLADLTEPIEKSYREGMGFDRERHWERKINNDANFLYYDTEKNTSR
jgi:hypothetical protein